MKSTRCDLRWPMAVACALLGLGSLTVWTAAAPVTDDWPMFRGNPQSSGIAVGTLPEKLEVLWKFEVPQGSFESTPAIVGGVVYLTEFSGKLIAVDLASGEKKWEVATELGFSASPLVREGFIYVGDVAGEFYCFDLQGEKKWQFTATGEINSSANFFRDKILVGSQDATLYCLNAQTGAEVWRLNANDQIQCSPTIVEDRCFIAGCDGNLHVVDLNDGKELGTVPMSQTMSTPVVSGDAVFCGSEQAGFFAVDWRNLKSLWHLPVDAPIHSSPTIAQGRGPGGADLVIFGAQNRRLYACHAGDGQSAWEFTARGKIDASPVLVGDRVLVADSSGRLYALAAAEGQVRQELDLGGGFVGSPAIADGRLVIASKRGVVYCLGAK